MLCKRTLCSNRQTFATSANAETPGDGFFITDTARVLPSGEPAVQNSIAETAQIDANQYAVLQPAWTQIKAEMAGDTTAQDQAEQNRSLMALFNQLDKDSAWLIYFGTQQRANEMKAAWVSYVSWLNGKPDYLNSQGEVPNGWSGYVNLFFGFNGWLTNYAPQKYKHL